MHKGCLYGTLSKQMETTKMMFEHLHAYIAPLVSFTPAEKEIFEDAFSFQDVPKKTKLIPEGAIAREMFFIRKGIVRLYYTKDGRDITGFIFKENLFASSYDSFLQQRSSVQTLETVEDCELMVMTYERLGRLYEQLPKINLLTRKVAEQRFINAQQILSSFILDSPEERYRKFAEQHPDLLLRVPLQYIASFLGITPVSLSRIRKRYAQ
jgi:CRP-like cAMP-binding protein